mgnify:CR=1 FL=1
MSPQAKTYRPTSPEQQPTDSEPTDSGSQSVVRTLAYLWPYIWPHDRPDLQRRVCIAAFFLVCAKLITAATPFFFKYATDALAGKAAAIPLFALPPLMLIVAFIVGRVLVSGFNQLRDALFARVGQHAVRKLAIETFTHMHQLSLRFHLERQTGGLSRLIERGTKGIESIVRYTVLNTMPVIIEFALYLGIFAYYFGWAYVVVIAVTVCAYSVFTIKTSDWRTKIRRDMNQSDTAANSKAVDALLNFETVKYFGNEAAEARRFDRSMAQYEAAATKTWTSLGWLNFGQALIFALGMLGCMILSARAVQNGTQTIGDFVMVHVTARTHYRGLVKRRLIPILCDGPPPAPGRDIVWQGKTIGASKTAAPAPADAGQSVLLALLKLEDIHAILAAADAQPETDLTVDGVLAKLCPPTWCLPLPVPTPKPTSR